MTKQVIHVRKSKYDNKFLAGSKVSSKINLEPWKMGWGVDSIEKELRYLIDLLDSKDLTSDEAEKARKAFEEICDYCEGLKESAWGEDR